MAQIKSRGNASTERKAIAALERAAIAGWVLHPEILGTPDFYFPGLRLAVFLDGCFWHGCPQCGHIPKTNVEYWTAKISRNQRRDKATRSELRKQGYRVLQVWEHELREEKKWITRLKRAIRRYSKDPA
jgi:DNA mismatch endonuclease (patch repair protein)